MPKTITLRLDESSYALFKSAAQAEKRTISNFIEYAALHFLSGDAYVSDEEMQEILEDSALLDELARAKREAQAGKINLVP